MHEFTFTKDIYKAANDPRHQVVSAQQDKSEDKPAGRWKGKVSDAMIKGGTIGAVGGLVAGAAVGLWALPALGAWIGANVIGGTMASYGIAGGTLFGLKASTWLGGMAGLAAGSAAFLTPMWRAQTKGTSHTLSKNKLDKELPETQADNNLQPALVSKPHINESSSQTVYRLGTLAAGTGIAAGALCGAFAGAATGMVYATCAEAFSFVSGGGSKSPDQTTSDDEDNITDHHDGPPRL